MSKNDSDYQDLLKLIAVIAMIIDHLGLYFIHADGIYQVLRVIGRIAMPIFCLSAGFNNSKPKAQTLIFGIILFFINLCTGHAIYFCMLIAILLGQMYLHKLFSKKYYIVHIIALLGLSFTLNATLSSYGISLTIDQFLEYGVVGIIIVIFGRVYAISDCKNKAVIVVSITIAYIYNFIHLISFKLEHQILMMMIMALGFYLITFKHFDKKIQYNLKPISRKSGLIYFLNIAIFQIFSPR